MIDTKKKIGQGKTKRARTPDPHRPHSRHTKGKHTHAGVVLSGGGGSLLAAAVAIAAGTQAYGDTVRYDNLPEGAPGWFDWTTPDPGQSRRWLDVMEDVANQPLGVGNVTSAFGQASSESSFGEVRARDDLGIAAMQLGGYGDYNVAGVDSGVLIPSGLPWGGRGLVDYYGAGTPEGAPSYVGVMFDPGDGVHYGWIGVVRTGTQLETFAWGYETEVGVAIAAGAGNVPAPGTLAVLAFGALAARSRKRKDN